MTTFTIDGTVEEATFKRGFSKMHVWGPIVFRRRDGTLKTINKAIVASSLSPYITPGNSGRFYLYDTVDHRGIHGVRPDAGEAHYAFAKNNEIGSVVCAVIGLFLLIMWYVFDEVISGWAILCLIIGIPGYFIYRHSRVEAERQFDADSDYVPRPAPVPAP